MQLKLIFQYVQQIIASIQNTGIFVVRELRKISKSTFKVRVENPQTKVQVSGSVEVSNNKVLADQIKNIALSVRELQKFLKALKKVEVENFPKPVPFPKFPAFPKSFKVDNFPATTKISNMNEFLVGVQKVVNQIEKLDLKPVVNVPAPVVNVPKAEAPIVNVPAPVVNVEKPDLSDIHKIITFLNEISRAKPLAVRLSDGKQFYKALEKMADIYAGSTFSAFQVAGGGEGRAMLNNRNEVKVTVSDTWDANDVDKLNSTTTYFGEETAEGTWRVRKVVKAGTITSIRHATKRNNDGYTEYEAAWADRENLEFGYAREAL